MKKATTTVAVQPTMTSQKAILIVFDLDPFFDDRRLHVELHPGRDRRADDAQDHAQIFGVEMHFGPDEGPADLMPIRLGQDRRDDVGQQAEAEEKENALGGLVVSFGDEDPDPDRDEGNGDVFTDPENHQTAGHAGEFRGGISDIGGHESDEDQEGDFHAEVFADKVGQALARHDPHPGVHLLDDDQDDEGGDAASRAADSRRWLRPRNRS